MGASGRIREMLHLPAGNGSCANRSSNQDSNSGEVEVTEKRPGLETWNRWKYKTINFINYLNQAESTVSLLRLHTLHIIACWMHWCLIRLLDLLSGSGDLAANWLIVFQCLSCYSFVMSKDLCSCTIQKNTVMLNCVWHQDSRRDGIIGIMGCGKVDADALMVLSSAWPKCRLVAALRGLTWQLAKFRLPSFPPFLLHPSMVRLRLLLPGTFVFILSLGIAVTQLCVDFLETGDIELLRTNTHRLRQMHSPELVLRWQQKVSARPSIHREAWDPATVRAWKWAEVLRVTKK